MSSYGVNARGRNYRFDVSTAGKSSYTCVTYVLASCGAIGRMRQPPGIICIRTLHCLRTVLNTQFHQTSFLNSLTSTQQPNSTAQYDETLHVSPLGQARLHVPY
jgi:hypothetical protein